MSSDLVDWVYQRIDEDGLDDEIGLLVAAALEGDGEFDRYLAGGQTIGERPGAAEAVARPSEPAGAFLRSVEVEGFRGIGSPLKVELAPRPGLAVIAGRNGSGKSSLAEALKVLLTGSTYRWKNKAVQWQERWRNLHHERAASIVVEVVEESAAPTTISCSWAAGVTDVADREVWVQRKGEKRQDGLAPLGWERPLETFRPMLSYDELGGLLEAGPSELYDALAQVLGMEQLTDALKRIQARLKALKTPGAVVASDRKQLLAEATALEGDERAAEVARLLKSTSPDVGAVRSIATGVEIMDRGPLADLRRLCQLTSPDAATAKEAAARLRSTVAAMAEVGEATSRRRVARLEVRKHALQVHRELGDMSCPVCATGRLDDEWARTSWALVAEEEAELAGLTRVREDLEAARATVSGLVARRPPELNRAPTPSLEKVVTEARQAWDDWSALPESDLDLADHVELHSDELSTTLRRLRATSSAAIAELDDAWSPLAGRVAAWCDRAEEWLESKAQLDLLAAAEKWLKDNDIRLKNERIAPIAEGARRAWSLLRQESNVDLGELKLEGTATRRRVRITASVDGSEATALSVMSQGELHALALALFLPRATMADSPFRFLILDDPVQAMDPAKVDGFVKLLAEVATSRQVLVLSHDDRLPAAIRRSRIDATLMEMTRSSESRVRVTKAQDPATRYLADARALLKDKSLPERTLRRTLPGLLRMAVESAARDRFVTVRLTRGEPLHEVEQEWSDRKHTRERVSLAVYDEVRSLDHWQRAQHRKVGLGCVTSAVHSGLHGGTHPDDAVRYVSRMVEDLRTGAK